MKKSAMSNVKNYEDRCKKKKYCCCGGHSMKDVKKNKHHNSTKMKLWLKKRKEMKKYLLSLPEIKPQQIFLPEEAFE